MSLVERARALWESRGILWLLIVRDLKVRYAGSVLGYLWTILDPLMMTGVYWFVFSVVFTGRRIGEDPYVLFIVMGLLSWQWFSATITGCSTALGAEARLVRSTALPREIWVLKVVGSKGAEFLFSLPIVALFMLLYHRAPSWQIVLVPIAIVLQAILLTGIGLALAPATVLIRDLSRVVRIALRVLFYLSPVIYSVRRLEIGPVRQLFKLNPMTGHPRHLPLDGLPEGVPRLAQHRHLGSAQPRRAVRRGSGLPPARAPRPEGDLTCNR